MLLLHGYGYGYEIWQWNYKYLYVISLLTKMKTFDHFYDRFCFFICINFREKVELIMECEFDNECKEQCFANGRFSIETHANTPTRDKKKKRWQKKTLTEKNRRRWREKNGFWWRGNFGVFERLKAGKDDDDALTQLQPNLKLWFCWLWWNDIHNHDSHLEKSQRKWQTC